MNPVLEQPTLDRLDRPTVLELRDYLTRLIENEAGAADLPVATCSVVNPSSTRPATFMLRHTLEDTPHLPPRRRLPLWDAEYGTEKKGPLVLFVW